MRELTIIVLLSTRPKKKQKTRAFDDKMHAEGLPEKSVIMVDVVLKKRGRRVTTGYCYFGFSVNIRGDEVLH